MASESNDGSTAAAESTSVMADGSTDTASDAVTDEERLRQEAARRLERRRRKMMSPEERLAKITGRPVAASSSPDTSPTVQMPGDPIFICDNQCCNALLFLGSEELTAATPCTVATNTAAPADDPPLETLTRDSGLLAPGPGLGGPEGDLLSSLLGGGGGQPGGAAGGAAAAGSAGTNTDVVWVLLAVVVRLALDTEYAALISSSALLPFALTLSLLYTLGWVVPHTSTVSSLLSAGNMSNHS